jgi:hypothetical protein
MQIFSRNVKYRGIVYFISWQYQGTMALRIWLLQLTMLNLDK